MNNKPTILFTATFSTPFIREDIRILQTEYSVHQIISAGIFTFLKFLFVLPRVDITFSWFASVYASILVYLSKFFHKRSILILGGVDVAKIPELNYGIWNSWWKSKIVRYGITHADVVLAVDPSIKSDAMTHAHYDGKNIHVIPTGYDDSFWKPGPIKENFVLTVANCYDETRFKIKGIDFLYDVARSMPDIHFLLIGLKEKLKRKYPPPTNLTTYDFKSQYELLEIYQRAKVYFQPSRREALGGTLCEAMLCECYPIGTNVGGIPTVIQDTGTLIQFGNKDEALHAIRNGMIINRSPKARERIVNSFSLMQREKNILEYVRQLSRD